MSLRQTIKSIQKQAADERESRERVPALMEEWTSSVGKFYECVRALLKEFIDEGSILTSSGNVAVSEEVLGQYTAATMNLHVGDVTLKFQPVGRFVIGGTGRIDLFRAGSGSEANRSMFIREGEGESEKWEIKSIAAQSRRLLVELNQENLETEIDLLLRRL